MYIFIEKGQIRSRKSSTVMGAGEFSLVPSGSAGQDGGGGGRPAWAATQLAIILYVPTGD